jgi:hypothetical protein
MRFGSKALVAIITFMSCLKQQTIPATVWFGRTGRAILLSMTLVTVLASRQAAQGAIDVSETFYGAGAGNNSATGQNDSAFGYQALNSETSGTNNTALGAFSLNSNTVGAGNTATGIGALQSNVAGSGHSQRLGGAQFQFQWRGQYSYWCSCVGK